eukprot:g7724.t1
MSTFDDAAARPQKRARAGDDAQPQITAFFSGGRIHHSKGEEAVVDLTGVLELGADGAFDISPGASVAAASESGSKSKESGSEWDSESESESEGESSVDVDSDDDFEEELPAKKKQKRRAKAGAPLANPTSDELRARIDEVLLDGRMWKIGQAFERQLYCRWNSNQYDNEYFDRQGAIVLCKGINDKAHANLLETDAIQYAKHELKVGVNVKESESSMKDHYSHHDPGAVYAVPVLPEITSQQDFTDKHISYFKKRQQLGEHEVDENGRKKHKKHKKRKKPKKHKKHKVGQAYEQRREEKVKKAASLLTEAELEHAFRKKSSNTLVRLTAGAVKGCSSNTWPALQATYERLSAQGEIC